MKKEKKKNTNKFSNGAKTCDWKNCDRSLRDAPTSVGYVENFGQKSEFWSKILVENRNF